MDKLKREKERNIMRNYKAYFEAVRTQNKSAFNIQGAYSRKKLNQHCTEYLFDDGSTLQILAGRSKAWLTSCLGPDTKEEFKKFECLNSVNAQGV